MSLSKQERRSKQMPNTYAKQYMSITELTETGLSRDYLKQLSRVKEAPIIRTMGGGKIYFKTSELDAFMTEVSKKGKMCRK
jgi:hypothetical protein